uniref:Uncharacterized protein n=1 Tax=Physcomitrium patens TaxID=3218 RepID=A0A2K1JW24_PHYPA|nr:hypothetical protein PHYPA_015499 [Physcomitrium patens]
MRKGRLPPTHFEVPGRGGKRNSHIRGGRAYVANSPPSEQFGLRGREERREYAPQMGPVTERSCL